MTETPISPAKLYQAEIARLTLSVADAWTIGQIIGMSRDGAKVARVADTPEGAVYGTARGLVDEHMMRPREGTDVRDMYLHVTTRQGMEVLWPVRELIDQFRETTFTRYDW